MGWGVFGATIIFVEKKPMSHNDGLVMHRTMITTTFSKLLNCPFHSGADFAIG